jgi:ABC-type Na+ efflux pump permease subunit
MKVFAGVLGVLLAAVLVVGAVGWWDSSREVGLWLTILVVFLLLGGSIFLYLEAPPGKLPAIAQAAYRETVRQPLFWFLLVFFLFFMFFSIFIPYFTLRDDSKGRTEDLKMFKQVQLDSLLLPALLLTLFTASLSVSEELEGRTAITLLSKPVSRRQFLLGKFVGILLAAMLLMLILSIFLAWTVHYRIDYEEVERFADPAEVVAARDTLSFLPTEIQAGLRYFLLLFAELQALAPGIVMALCQVTILTAIAIALATRLPMAVTLVICFSIFLMGRLTHVLVQSAQDNPLVKFIAQVFETLLPGLNYYDTGPAIVAEVDVPWAGYVLPAALHGLLYSTIALLFGLILFEDRDLA